MREQGVGADGGFGLIILELHERDRALLLDEGAHEGGVGVEGVAADDRAVEGAGGQGGDEGVGEGFLVAGSALGDLHEGFAGLGVTEGDEGGESAVQGFAIDGEQRRQAGLRELPGDEGAGEFTGREGLEDFAPADFAGRGHAAGIVAGTAETERAALGVTR